MPMHDRRLSRRHREPFCQTCGELLLDDAGRLAPAGVASAGFARGKTTRFGTQMTDLRPAHEPAYVSLHRRRTTSHTTDTSSPQRA
jgi:hypothetical protein